MAVRNPEFKNVTAIVFLALAYFVTGRLGLMLPAFGSHITLIWLPTGIAVAALLRFGFGCWPGVALGAVAVNLATGARLPVALGIAMGNTLGPLLAAWVLRRIGFQPEFDRKRDILLLAGAAVAGMFLSASLGVCTLALAGLLPDGRVAAWLAWWAGDATGVVVAAPLVFVFTRSEVRAILQRWMEFAVWLCPTVLATWAVFIANRGSDGRPWSLAFLPLPMVAWAALRFGPAGTSVALIVLSVGAAYGTGMGLGPFFRADRVESVAELWIYMASSAVIGWLISALNTGRERATGVRRLFERALTDVSLGVLLAGLDRRITYVNEGFTRLTGYSADEMLGKGCEILQGPETDAETAARLKAAMHGDGNFDGEILNYRKDGSAFWNTLLISPVCDESGARTGFLGIQRDATERKKAELALVQSEEHLRTIIELEPECVKLLSMDGRLLEMNPAGLAMIEAASIEEVRGREIGGLIVPEDRATFAAMHARVVLGASGQCEYGIVGLKGTRRWMETHAVPYRNSKRKIVGVLGITRDVTERRKADAELERSLATLQLFIDTVPAYIAFVDVEERYRLVNKRYEEYFGLPADKIVGQRLADVQPPAVYAETLPHIRTVLGGTLVHYELNTTGPTGTVRWFDVQYVPRLNGGGEVSGFFALVFDITARKHAEAEREKLDRKIQETQKLESLGVLAGGIAHDFNNLLTSILGNASLATLDLPPGSPVAECIEQITESSMRAADLCKQMLAYSGRGRFVVERLDLGALVERTAQMLQISISKKSVLRFHLEKGLPRIEADATQIRQVVMNLVINASEAIVDRSGVISISTGLARVDRDYLAGTLMDPDLPEGDYVFLEVADSGCGMNPETLDRIFDPFFTTKFTGRGLGLAAALGIVRGHKGALKVDSEVGRGTTFKLLFPAVADAGESAPEVAAQVPGWRGDGTVLVVDDEETMRTTLSRMMRVLGLEPVLARDGQEAVEIFSAAPGRFAFVLLDLTMPRMDGEQAFTELRRLRPDVRVVLMSGFNAQEALVRFDGRGLASFLQKPFTVAALRAVLQTVLG